jgi:hypothetical protein
MNMNRPMPSHPQNREAQMAIIAKEERIAKKRVKAGIMAALGGGAGFALYLLQRIFDGLTGSDATNAMIDNICLMLMAYAVTIIVSFIFFRKWVLKINMIMVYAVIPGILLKIFMDMN